MAGRAIAVDLGSHASKVIQVKDGKHGLAVERFGWVAGGKGGGDLGDTQIDLKGAVTGLAGRDMTLKYSQVPDSPDYQLRRLMELEIEDLAAQSGGALAADFNLLPAAEQEDGTQTVILALAKEDALDRLTGAVEEAGGSVAGHTPNCVALFNAWLKCGSFDADEVVCLASLGHETVDIAIARGAELLFARNLGGGGKVLDESIANAFGVSIRKAESLKRDLLDLDPGSRGRYASREAEKVTVQAGGAASSLVSAIQSSFAFCKQQTQQGDLQLDKVWICGGSAKLRGVQGMLRETLRVPVDRFDPFAVCDLSGLPDDEAEQLRVYGSEAVVALGLAVGRIEDDAYELLILPESVRKKRQFAERTVFNIGAALVGVALLVLAANTYQSQDKANNKALQLVQGQAAGIRSKDRDARERIEANEGQRKLVDALAQRAMPLDAVVAVQRALDATLPPQLWVTNIRCQTVGGAGRGDEPRAKVVVDGLGTSLNGVDPVVVFTSFLAAFQAHPLIKTGSVTHRTPPNPDFPLGFQLTFDPMGDE